MATDSHYLLSVINLAFIILKGVDKLFEGDIMVYSRLRECLLS